MKTSIATVSISGSLPEKLEAISKAGFDGIEIFEQDFITHDGNPRDVGNIIRDMGLEISLFQPFRDFEGLPDPLRAKAFDRAERKFDLMQELGTDLVLICSSCHPQALGGIDRAAADLQELGVRAQKRGLRIGYEALAWGCHVDDHRDAWEIVRRADHANVGLILDSFHTLARKIDPQTIQRIPADKIFFVQLADAPQIEMDLLYLSRHFRNMPGEGDLPLVSFMKSVMATGYQGPISLEIFNDQFRGGPAGAIAKDGYRALMALMDDVCLAENLTNPAFAPMPKRQNVESVSFIEFATRDAESQGLEGRLTALGFSKTAKHNSKDLDLWTQGDLKILLNRETIGHAYSAYLTHGTSVCDMGLQVSDARAAVARASALGAGTFDQMPTKEELAIPAIRGLNGTVLHFIDEKSGLTDVWGVEFTNGQSPKAGVGLTHIDHIALTMSYNEMLSWSLFYSSLFTMQKTPMVDVIDPDGLVRSQALATPDGRFRITLNGAETHRTLAGNFLAGSFGASVQHIAFASADIFSTKHALDGLDFSSLPMAPNYYADLAARFDLSADYLAALQEDNILYDQDENGAFLQIYAKLDASGMFFEIVERKNNYQGYGAANAPFRIAAQKRLMRAKGMPAL